MKSWVLAITVMVAILIAVIVRIKNWVQGEWFRKLLHFVCLIILGVWVWSHETWWESVIGMLLFVIVLFPVLKVLERRKWFEKFLAARKKGELANSLLIVGGMFIIITLCCQGLFDSKLLTIASIYAWGPGDAAAALIGKKFGKHKLRGEKSLEGTLAMFLTSFACVFLLLLLGSGFPLVPVIITAIVTADVAAATELYSKNGNDTIICPVASMIALIVMLCVTGNLALPF